MKQVSQEMFEQEVLKNSRPVVVDFSAVWCGTCRQIAPFVEQIADEMSSDVDVVQVDVDEADALALKYDIQSLPTLLVFKNGKNVASHVGGAGKSELIDWIKSNI